MSGNRLKPQVTVATMKERQRLNKQLQDSPPTPPKTYLDDIPIDAPAPGIRRSTRGKTIQVLTPDVIYLFLSILVLIRDRLMPPPSNKARRPPPRKRGKRRRNR
jgi:hypothetical protein